MIGELFLADDMLALYHLGDLFDSSGNGRNLTNSGGVTFVDAGYGKAAYFGNPNAGYLYRSDMLGLSGLTDSFTIFGAANPSALSTSMSTSNVIFELADSANALSVKLSAYYSSASGVYFVINDSGSSVSISGRQDLRNRWFWWAVVMANSEASLYINGRYYATILPAPEPLVEDTGFSLGQGLDGSNPWRGYIDEVSLRTAVLPAGDLGRWAYWAAGWLDSGA
jgi:hypothetical protein